MAFSTRVEKLEMVGKREKKREIIIVGEEIDGGEEGGEVVTIGENNKSKILIDAWKRMTQWERNNC